jgi:hypothetical protein
MAAAVGVEHAPTHNSTTYGPRNGLILRAIGLTYLLLGIIKVNHRHFVLEDVEVSDATGCSGNLGWGLLV